MGNYLEIDLSKYGCDCMDQEDGDYLDFAEDMKEKATPFVTSMLGEKDKILNKNDISTFTTQSHTPNGIKSIKKYESIKISPNDNINDILNIDKVKEEKKKEIDENRFSLLDDKNYLKEFEYSETEVNFSNNENSINDHKNKSKNEDIDEEEDEELEDIKNLNLNTDYFQLANQIAESINELRNNVFNQGKTSNPTPTPKNPCYNDFERLLKKSGKIVDIICFNDVIGCIKKISDINSEVTLINEKIYLGIVNKFKRNYSLTHFINFNDENKIVDIPNFNKIKNEIKAKLGKYNNPKFQFNKFTLRDSFPNQILIWKLISQNMEKISDIIKNNYYCCAVLFHKGKKEEENETIIYLINKIAN